MASAQALIKMGDKLLRDTWRDDSAEPFGQNIVCPYNPGVIIDEHYQP
jgi:hypothetical protein